MTHTSSNPYTSTFDADSPELAGLFRQLNQGLEAHRQYWQFRPFSEHSFPWHSTTPTLSNWLNQLDPDDLEQLEKQPELAQQQLQNFIPGCKPLLSLSQLPQLEFSSKEHPGWMSNHIPGRKWQQIQAFENAIDNQAQAYLEWCSGKGHLARLVAHQRQQPVVCIELQPKLCQQGQLLAQRHSLPMTFKVEDALHESSGQHITGDQHVLALHACGDLHTQLLRHSATRKPAQLSLSPCCYHLIKDETYSPLSTIGQSSQLVLDHHDLRLPLQQTVTAGARINRLRRIEVTWRLGFDQLQRKITGIDSYLNTPNIPKRLLSGTFADYCQWMADKKNLSVPIKTDFSLHLAEADERYLLVQKLELIRHLFRRPLELWLILDRALFLQQQGYQIKISEFCDYQLTPRNILIQARRKS